MIREVRLRNFVSHSDSRLELKDGVNIFVGRNGAGKSSVIDAITYALFGKHTRGANSNLVRRGSPEGRVEVTFDVGGRRYLAARRVGADGGLIECVLKELTETGPRTLVAGERRQYDESMSQKVASVIGLDYQKMRVATIVQQGELDSIVTEYSPRQMKELINDMIGIGSLDQAYENAREVLEGFRTRLRGECLNYDDRTLGDLEGRLSQDDRDRRRREGELSEISEKLLALEGREASLSQRLRALEEVRKKTFQLQEKKGGLYEHVKQVRKRLLQEVEETEGMVPEALSRLEVAAKKEEMEREWGEIERQEEELNGKMNELSSLLGELKAMDVEELRREVAEVSRKLGKLEREVSRLEEEMKELESMERPGERKELEGRRVRLQEIRARLENEMGEIRGKLRDYRKIEETGVCPTCDSEIEPEDIGLRITRKEEEERRKEEERRAVGEELERVEGLLRELDRYERAQEKLDERRKRKEEAEEEMKELQRKKEKVEAELAAALQKASSLPTIEMEHGKVKEKLEELKAKKKEMEGKRKEVLEAEAWLKENGILGVEDVKVLQAKAEELKDKLEAIPEEPMVATLESLRVDEYSSELVAQVMRLEEETKGFREEEYEEMKVELERRVRPEKEALLREKGEVEGEVRRLVKEMEELVEAKRKIEVAAKYVQLFEKIRSNVYNRDGAVATSLRSWALKEIERRASDYVRLFSMGISSIRLEERKRVVEMACYGGSGKREVGSMSGGEKVAVALALRFAMANLMGKGRTDFIILDEPTTHLDVERRKYLVELISGLNRAQEEGLTLLNQVIVITHDEEVFEGSEVNGLFRFEVTPGGSVVSAG